jgi:hypothetical protein
MESAAIDHATDDVNFTALSSWFMRYHRIKEKARISALPKRSKPASQGKAAGDDKVLICLATTTLIHLHASRRLRFPHT